MKKSCSINNKVLKRLKNEGKCISFDDDSKIVFISDVHRGDGGNADSLRLNYNIYKAALIYYYRHHHKRNQCDFHHMYCSTP